jgi:hypothetical protein
MPQENSGATGLIFVTYVTRQHPQILYKYTVVNTVSMPVLWLEYGCCSCQYQNIQ